MVAVVILQEGQKGGSKRERARKTERERNEGKRDKVTHKTAVMVMSFIGIPTLSANE